MNPDSLTRFCSSALVWIAEPAVRAIVIAAMIAAALFILRVKHPSLQIAAWITVLCAAIALPALGWILPSVFISLPAWQMRTHKPAPSLSATFTRPAGVLPTSASVTTPVSHSAAANEVRKPILAATRAVVGWPVLAFAAYLLGVAFFAGRLCIGLVLTRRMRVRATPIEDRIPRQWMEHYTREMHLQRLPELLESSAVNVPLTLGLLRTAIVIPEDWCTWEDGKLSAVIAHELSHARRRDPGTRILAASYRSAFWFSPLSWWLEHHLAELGERASDQAAISAGTEPTYYAEVLMSFFRDIQNREGRMNWQGARMAGGRRAVERIDRVLSSQTLQPSSFKKSHLCLALAGALAVVCIAAAARPRFVMAAQLTSPAAPASPATSPSTAAPPSVPAVSPVPAPRSPANVPAVIGVPAPPAIPESGELSTTIQGTIATPAVPSVLLGGIPSPPELAADDGNVMYRNTTLSGAMDFAIVYGGSVTMNGSQDDRQEVESLRKKIPGDFIWFIHGGSAYMIRDSATVQSARQLYSQMDGLGKQMEELGQQQDALGKQMDLLGKQMEAVRIQVPADLAQHLKEVEEKLNALGGTADMDQLGKLQEQLGDLQGKLGDLQGKAGESQGKLGEQQGALGEKQGELGRRQGELGSKQADIGSNAARQMQDIINKALASGAAKRVE